MKKATSILLVCLIGSLPWAVFSQSKVKATGTGNTTGHIANLCVQNLGDNELKVAPVTAFIPSDGGYQPYITFIPATTIPPKTTTIIPLDGYCADVYTPPMPTDHDMPPIKDWIPIGPRDITSVPEGIPILPHKPVPPFEVADIPQIISSPEFTPVPEITPRPFIPTWPGTQTPVNGTIDIAGDPETFAPVIVEALDQIANAFDKLKLDGEIDTPFSGDPAKERESVIQQTFWIYTSSLSDKPYEKEHFNDKVIQQFEKATGITAAIPETEKHKLTDGVDTFWNTFMATGTEAKVLRNTESAGEEKRD